MITIKMQVLNVGMSTNGCNRIGLHIKVPATLIKTAQSFNHIGFSLYFLSDAFEPLRQLQQQCPHAASAAGRKGQATLKTAAIIRIPSRSPSPLMGERFVRMAGEPPIVEKRDEK